MQWFVVLSVLSAERRPSLVRRPADCSVGVWPADIYARTPRWLVSLHITQNKKCKVLLVPCKLWVSRQRSLMHSLV